MAKPVAVLISDVHYNLNTLELADKSMRQAITSANCMGLPLIVAGDLHDTKANLRGECIEAMLNTFRLMEPEQVFVIVGNHDKISEKSNRNSLEFLRNYVQLISEPCFTNSIACNRNSLEFIPYQHDTENFKTALRRIDKRSIIIAHQGILGSNSGEYIQDKTALKPEYVAGRRIISGHYHTRQDIVLPNGGLWSYIGNPYTLNYAEAKDPEKGFQILFDDGSLVFVPTNLRKHAVFESEVTVEGLSKCPKVNSDDLLWIKIQGTKEQLQVFDKKYVSSFVKGVDNFKLDHYPLEVNSTITEVTPHKTDAELMDSLIYSLSNTSQDKKQRLSTLWKDL